jgi:excisionase family DNA binding protein
MSTDEFLTVKETAALLHMSERAVSRLLREGTLPGIFGGTREGWRVRRSEVLNLRTNSPRRERGEGRAPGPL